jgi:uncharacterized protein (TIGR03437 family)
MGVICRGCRLARHLRRCGVTLAAAAVIVAMAVSLPGATGFNEYPGGKGHARPREVAREKWLWHLANSARLERTKGAAALAAAQRAPVYADINDMTVMQGDAFTVSPQNLFDLNGDTVTFTRAGSGYTFTATAGALDTNFGAKLDFTTGAAVNPNPQAEPGDDAYLVEDLGFAFPFYATAYSQMAISTNGNVVFRPAGTGQSAFDSGASDSGESLSEFQSGLPRIAPYWHDLDARAQATRGTAGIYLRKDPSAVVITFNHVPDFQNSSSDTGVQRFQLKLSADGSIQFTYASVQLTSRALVGITPGQTNDTPMLVTFSRGSGDATGVPLAEVFSTATITDDFAVLNNFYETHGDNYDYVYLSTDFSTDLGDAFAYFASIRNSIQGIGRDIYDMDPNGDATGSRRLLGYLNLANITQYPNLPTTRFLGANHALSIMGQEQGHAWGVFVNYPGPVPNLLLGRDDQHWSFYLNIESTLSRPAARRSSSMEGNVWRDNGDGTFTSVNLIDGYSRMDHYLMGLRPPSDVPDTFVITNPTSRSFTRVSNPRPGVTTGGGKQTVGISGVLSANGPRIPDSAAAPKQFRSAWVLLTMPGTQASPATLDRLLRYRLAWESYFSQATDYLGSLNAGLAESPASRGIAVVSGADYSPVLAPGGIGSIFGVGLTAGRTEATTSADLPLTLAGTQLKIDGVDARLYFASPDQINFQVPAGAIATTSTPGVNSATSFVEVISKGQLIRAGTFQIAPVSPSLFSTDLSGSGPAAALDAITFAAPPFNATQPNGQPNIIAVFGTGAGIDATILDANIASSFAATIDGNPATLTYAGRAPGFPGLNQFNVVLPANIGSGIHTLSLSRNGIATNQVTLAIR